MSLALCLKLLTCPTEALVSWMSRISSAASAMYLVAVFQEVTLAVEADAADYLYNDDDVHVHEAKVNATHSVQTVFHHMYKMHKADL